MNAVMPLTFTQTDLAAHIGMLDETELDALEFGVIGFDAETAVRSYNECESKCAGLTKERILGRPLFTNVAPCMNNFMVAHRFEEALDAGTSLDVTIDYVLTLRMRPVKVKLRLLASPSMALRYVLVHRLA